MGKYENIGKHIRDLDEKLKNMQNKVLAKYIELRRFEGENQKNTIQSLHNTIGSKNNDFAECTRMQFSCPEDFISQWLQGLCIKYGDKINKGPHGEYRYIILEMLKYPVCKEYIEIFLERNFYRNLNERKVYKPSEELWEVWFGSNKLFWGIMLSPTYRNGRWTNDVSEIRRAKYKYWTIGHILSTGIVQQSSPQRKVFSDLQEFVEFYKNELMSQSLSKYEKAIMERYVDFLEKHENVEEVPLLIPEFRYDGVKREHKYRFDFIILNSHTKHLIGFEISPQYTHMRIEKIQSKTVRQANKELEEKWEKEMQKRNDYFERYGITTITFADNELKNIDGCFNTVKKYLEERDMKNISYEEQWRYIQELLK